ncbi:MAG: hypothetical protein IJU93_07015 [Lachnospiraceae bacterium]|nr:hypothetical protein [Lachnospiraceae bacterium]
MKNAKWLPVLINCIGLICLLVFLSVRYEALIDSDASAEILLAKLLTQTGGIMTDRWYYSTELRVVNMQLLLKLALLFFADYKQARLFATFIYMVLIVGAFLIMMKSAGLFKAGLLATPFLLFPFCEQYIIYLLVYMGYGVYIFFSFLVMSTLFEILKEVEFKEGSLLPVFKGRGGVIRAAAFAAAGAVLCFIASLNGFRQLMVLNVPLFAAGVVFVIYDLYRHWKADGRFGACFGKGLFITAIAAIYAFAALCGVVVSGVFFSVYFSSDKVYQWNSFQFYNLYSCLADVANFFGWTHAQNIFSFFGLVNLLSLLMAVFSIYFTVKLVKGFRERRDSEKLLLVYTLCALVILLFMYSMINMYHAKYWLVIMQFVYTIPCILLAESEKKSSVVIYFGLICIVVLSSLSMFKVTGIDEEKSAYVEAEKWLTDNGYKQGYANYWQSNLFGELSSGALDMYTMDEDVDGSVDRLYDLKSMKRWLQDKKHATELPEGEFFVMLTRQYFNFDKADEARLLSVPEYLVYDNEYVRIYAFKDMEEYRAAMASVK